MTFRDLKRNICLCNDEKSRLLDLIPQLIKLILFRDKGYLSEKRDVSMLLKVLFGVTFYHWLIRGRSGYMRNFFFFPAYCRFSLLFGANRRSETGEKNYYELVLYFILIFDWIFVM